MNFTYPELFKYAYVILSCDLSSQISLGQKFNMADNMMFSVLLTIIFSLIAYLELSIATIPLRHRTKRSNVLSLALVVCFLGRDISSLKKFNEARRTQRNPREQLAVEGTIAGSMFC